MLHGPNLSFYAFTIRADKITNLILVFFLLPPLFHPPLFVVIIQCFFLYLPPRANTRLDKIESFTRSRSSSMSSLENIGNESIQFLIFANTYVAKNGKQRAR